MASLFSFNEDVFQIKIDISALEEEEYYISQDTGHTWINETVFVSHKKSSDR